VIEYLEEELAVRRGYKLPSTPPARPDDPQATAGKPGGVAMPEFWSAWGWELKPSAAMKANAPRAKTLASTVAGKRSTTQPVEVVFDKTPVESFNYNPDEKDSKAAARQSAILAEVIKAWCQVPPQGAQGQVRAKVASKSVDGRVEVMIEGAVDAGTYGKARAAALKYPQEFKTAIVSQLTGEAARSLDDKYRFALTQEVNRFRKKANQPSLDPSPVILAHPRLDLYADMDSAHAKEKIGCSSCHGGSGSETDFVLAGHTPKSVWVDAETGEPVFTTQLANPPSEKHGETMSSMLDVVWPEEAIIPEGVSKAHLAFDTHPAKNHGDAHAQPAHHEEAKRLKPFGSGLLDAPPHGTEARLDYVDPVTGQKRKAVTQLENWKKYEPESGLSFHGVEEFWETPMRTPEFLQANCARCHANITDIADEAPVLYEGRTLFAKMGCVNCHQMDSIPADDPKEPYSGDKKRVGPDLRNVNAKLSPAFINSWIWAPKSFRPSTLMPHFFMLENNSSDEEIRRTRLESRAITEYLLTTGNRYPQTGADGKPVEKDGKPVLGPWQPQAKVDPKLKGDVAQGQALFNTLGCMACHTNLADKDEEDVIRGERWILRDLIRTAGLPEEEAQKTYDGMTYNQKQWYVWERFGALTSSGTNKTYPPASDEEKTSPVPVPIFMNAGPELSGVGDKLTAGRTVEEAQTWLFDWIKNPRHYSSYTIMPNFRLSDQEAAHLTAYLLAQHRKNLDDKDNWKAELFAVDQPKLNELVAWFLRSAYSPQIADKKAVDPTEVRKIAEATLIAPSIMTETEGKAAVASMDLQKQQLVFLGKKLVTHYGCFNCHAINGMENVASPCANLSDWGQKQVNKLAYEFLDPHKVHELEHDNPTLAIPMANGLTAQATAVGLGFDQKKFAEPVSEAVHVGWPEVEHSRDAWIEQKLKNTRVYDRGRNLLEPARKTEGGKPIVDKDGYPVLELSDRGRPYDKLKMPTFYFNDRQVHALVTFVISNRNRLITPGLLAQTNNDRAKRLATGRQVVERYNCVNCHIVHQDLNTMDSNYPSIHQYFESVKKEDMSKFWLIGPPSLHGEGSRIQYSWLFNFLKHVEPIRPQVQPRMPSFALTDLEAEQIAAYFNATSQQESKWLAKHLEPVKKYIAGKEKEAEQLAKAKAATQPAGTAVASTSARNPNDPWPGDDWYRQPGLDMQVTELRKWGLLNRMPQMTASNLDERLTKGFDLDKIYRSLLFEGRFYAELSDAPYPLVDSPRPDIADEQFKKGETFFYTMECTKCHVLGDPKVVTTFKLAEPPKGPNLVNAYRRLQWRWVDHWVQQTNVILPVGSPMPPFFDGLPAWSLSGLPFEQDQPTLADLPPDKLAKVKDHMAKFGATAAEQKDLLLNFVYAAGVRNHTVYPPPSTQPGGAATQAAPKSK
jgi:mono/diheme cytochrome c family protein